MHKKQRLMRLKKLLRRQRLLLLLRKRMLLTGRKSPRKPRPKRLKKWQKLKKQLLNKKPNLKLRPQRIRRSMMKLLQLKLPHSRKLKNRQKKHRRQQLQLDKLRKRRTSLSIRQKCPRENKSLRPNIEMYGLPVQQESHISSFR